MHDPTCSMLTYKVRFSDGRSPEVDWFPKDEVSFVEAEAEDDALGQKERTGAGTGTETTCSGASTTDSDKEEKTASPEGGTHAQAVAPPCPPVAANSDPGCFEMLATAACTPCRRRALGP